MSESVKKESIEKAYCSACKGERNCDVVGSHRVSWDGHHIWGHTDWRILRCRGCDEVFCQTVSICSDDIDFGHDEEGHQIATYIETKKYWPAPSKRKKPDWLDELQCIKVASERLVSPLNELYGALDADLPMLAGIAVRSCFEVVAEILGIESELTFQDKLKTLVAQEKLGASAETAISTAIEAGHAATHRGWTPEPDDLNTLVEILEAFIRDTLIEPARRLELHERAANLRERVPPKPPNPKKRTKAAQKPALPSEVTK
ncbi:DUF4145 domain-containing protein [Methylosinus sporium]|uniref:DUF4145 domain-containing protein n=1 Tax=Methylosinus sporium TaxID=428 RepID=UPI00383A59FA